MGIAQNTHGMADPDAYIVLPTGRDACGGRQHSLGHGEEDPQEASLAAVTNAAAGDRPTKNNYTRNNHELLRL